VPDEPSLKSGAWLIFDWTCNVMYAFEILSNNVAYGFIGHNAWVSVSYFHKMEFGILVCTVAEGIVQVRLYTYLCMHIYLYANMYM